MGENRIEVHIVNTCINIADCYYNLVSAVIYTSLYNSTLSFLPSFAYIATLAKTGVPQNMHLYPVCTECTRCCIHEMTVYTGPTLLEQA